MKKPTDYNLIARNKKLASLALTSASLFGVNSKLYQRIQNSDEKIVVLYGGAASGKSYTLAHYIIFEIFFKEKNKHILISRRTNPALKMSNYTLVIGEIERAGKMDKVIWNKSEQTLYCPKTRSKIFFKSIDDPEKIKSAEFNFIWLEEATEFNERIYRQCLMRIRRPTNTENKIYLTFNPTDESNWVHRVFFEKIEPETDIIKVTYLDNPFCSEADKKNLESYKETDYLFYQIYCLGNFGTITKARIYRWNLVNKLPDYFDEIIWGLDFGYNNPSALIKIGIKDDEFYIIEEFYQTHLTNNELIEIIRERVGEYEPVYADCAEPDRIREIYDAGFNVYESDKAVKYGIDFVKSKKIHVYAECENVNMEQKVYKWKEDKNGNILDEPVKYKDHSMDAIRYAIYTHYKDRGTEIEETNINIYGTNGFSTGTRLKDRIKRG